MREHLPTLLTRLFGLTRHAGHFYHTAVRMIEVGLFRFQREPRFFQHQVDEKPESAFSSNGDESSTPGPKISVEKDLPPAVYVPELPGSSEERSEQASAARLIISVHIPKTGGTTFLDVLKASAQEILYLDYGDGNRPTGIFRNGKPIEEPFEAIGDIESLPGRSVIHGHFHASKYFKQFPNAAFVTWLRDPVERLASHYFFWQRTPFMDDPLCNKVISEKMSLEEFARLDVLRNVHHKFLFPITVERFSFVGITEEYGRSLELFRRLVCPDVEVIPTIRNTNPNRLADSYDLEPGLRDRILELNELDVATYADGVRRFHHLCEQVGI